MDMGFFLGIICFLMIVLQMIMVMMFWMNHLIPMSNDPQKNIYIRLLKGLGVPLDILEYRFLSYLIKMSGTILCLIAGIPILIIVILVIGVIDLNKYLKRNTLGEESN